MATGERARATRAACLSAAVAGLMLGVTPARGADMSFNISLVGSLNPLAGQGSTNNIYADLWADGNLVALGSVSTGSGVTIIDNSNPAAPTSPWRYMPAGSANGQFRDVIVRNGIGYFAIDSSSTGGPATVGGVHIVNLASPTNTPMFVINAPQGFLNNHDLFLDGNYLYIADNRNAIMKVFNVANPAAPTFVRNVTTAGATTDNLHDMTVVNGRMYTSNLDNGITQIYDVTNMSPTIAPTLLGQFDVGTRNHSTWPNADGTLLAVGREDTAGEVQLWNIANPASPSLITSIHAATYGIDSHSAHNPIIIGDTLYVSWYQAGLQIFNIRNPSAPVHLGAYDTFVGGDGNAGSFSGYDGNWGLDVSQGNNRILLSDFDNGFFTVDAASAFRQLWTHGADTGKWQESSRWDSGLGPIPNSSEMIASFTDPVAGVLRTLTVDGSLTPSKPRVATIEFNAQFGYTIQAANGGEIELKSSSGPARITMAPTGLTNRLSRVLAPMALEDDLLVVNNAAAAAGATLQLGVIKGTNRAITFTGTGVTALIAANPNLSGSITLAGGTLQISNDNQLGNAANTITLAGGTLKTGAAITSNRTLVVGAGVGTIDTNGFNSSFGNLDAINQIFTKSGAGTLTVTRLRAHWLDLTAGAVKVAPNGTDASAVFLDGMNLSPGTALDLADNDLVVRFGNFNEIRSQVIAGFGTTAGITSSTSNGSQILALFDNWLVGAGQWAGQTINSTAIVGKYTYFGDANLDGQVSGDDYTVIDANLNTTPPAGVEWLSGDANLDGQVSGDDYTVIDANLGLGIGNPLSSSALVPEPGLAMWLAGSGLILMRRRLRR